MIYVALLLVTFAVAGCLRKRRVGALKAVFAGGLVCPVLVAFMTFIYPADPESRMWAMVAIPVSYAWGLAAAGLGYGVVALVERIGIR